MVVTPPGCLADLTEHYRASTLLDMTLTDTQIKVLQHADLAVREARAVYDNARLYRDRAIRLVAAEGGTYRDIGKVSGVAYQRVAQIVSGRPPATRSQDSHLDFECPKCGAAVGERCEGKVASSAHLERHHLAIAALHERHPELG